MEGYTYSHCVEDLGPTYDLRDKLMGLVLFTYMVPSLVPLFNALYGVVVPIGLGTATRKVCPINCIWP